MTDKKSDKIFFWGIFSIYIVISYFAVRTHELWGDEMQAWLIARDLPIIGIIKQMAKEGHSCMWHLILVPFAKFGFSCEIIKYISWSFCIVTVAIILKKAPFNKFLKVLLVFSTGFMYFYSAHSRCYSMIPLFLALIAVVYKNRHEKPYKYNILLFLLANTHVIMLPTVFLLLVFYIIEGLKNKKYEKKKVICSSIIGMLGIIIFLLQALQMYFSTTFVMEFSKYKGDNNIYTIFMDLISLIKQIKFQLVGSAIVPYWKFAVIDIAVILATLAIIGNKKQAVIFWGQLLFCIVLETLKWFSNVYRVVLIIYTMMFWLWNYNEDEKSIENKETYRKILSISFVIILVITIPQYGKLMIEDYTKSYSASKDTAEYIKENVNKGAVFICRHEDMVNAVIGYLKKDEYLFYCIDDENYFTYISDYDNLMGGVRSISSNTIEGIIKEFIDEGKTDIYYIERSSEIKISYAADNLEVIYEGKCIKNVNASGEEYTIYKIDMSIYM